MSGATSHQLSTGDSDHHTPSTSKAYTLVINCGSSSVKFAMFQQGSSTLILVYSGLAESLGGSQARLKLYSEAKEIKRLDESISSHETAIARIVYWIESDLCDLNQIVCVGHRVVHGGEAFSESCLIDDDVLEAIRSCSELAPLHNPNNIKGIELIQSVLPQAKQVAVFDTAFHQTLPEQAYMYALPRRLYEEMGLRRFGFHGSSHRFMLQRLAEYLNKAPEQVSLISAHLGNGASVCAIRDGKSVDTSMGLTPLEGLVMGTRCGDVDPGLLLFLLDKGYSADTLDHLLNRESGLLGLSSYSHDMRQLSDEAAKGNRLAELAIEVFCFQLAKYIAGMLVSLSHCDGLIFTGGIGENAANVRSQTIAHLRSMGFFLNEALNIEIGEGPIHGSESRPIMVFKTNEELVIAQDATQLAG